MFDWIVVLKKRNQLPIIVAGRVAWGAFTPMISITFSSVSPPNNIRIFKLQNMHLL